MKRTCGLVAALLVVLASAAGSAGAGNGAVFTVVSSTGTSTLPSAEVPNAPGSVALPPAWLAPRHSDGLPFHTLNGLWHRAGSAYGIPWQVLAAINKIESNFGRNMGPSSAGAVGWMQFMPSTWERWGTDADGDGVADPWNAQDAIFSAARYLAAAGGRTDLYRGIFAYNHAHWYVADVLELSRFYGHAGADVAFTLDRAQVRLDQARRTVASANGKLVKAAKRERGAARTARRLHQRAQRAPLLSDRLALLKAAVQADARRDEAAAEAERLRERLVEAQAALTEATSSAWTNSFAPGAASLVAAPVYRGDYVFPVGGGPSVVSLGHTHHDYPAADIAAPSGAPLYALADGLVEAAWHLSNGACGIGFKLQTRDGRSWTYCHLSYLEPAVQPGVALPAGAPVGLVGSTGRSTGPHLHLQLNPATSYPQDEAWFRDFAGTAFRWQDDETPRLAVGSASAPVFTILEEPATAAVITFTRERP
jgi:murein DD-endopeptidase MepM/ murein hydrolase activator NlpD